MQIKEAVSRADSQTAMGNWYWICKGTCVAQIDVGPFCTWYMGKVTIFSLSHLTS